MLFGVKKSDVKHSTDTTITGKKRKLENSNHFSLNYCPGTICQESNLINFPVITLIENLTFENHLIFF